MEQLVFYNENKKDKEVIHLIKTTDDDFYLGRSGKNIFIGNTSSLINYINYYVHDLTEVIFNGFNEKQVSDILSELYLSNDIQDTMFRGTYLISKSNIKKRIIKYDKMDERTRRSNI